MGEYPAAMGRNNDVTVRLPDGRVEVRPAESFEAVDDTRKGWRRRSLGPRARQERAAQRELDLARGVLEPPPPDA